SWSVAGSGANAANAADFQNGVLPGGVVSFAAGEASQIVKVRVVRDAVAEANEGFTVTLASPSGATINQATASGVIRNDDAAALPSLSIATLVGDLNEGTGTGVSVFSYEVTRSGDLSSASQVAWSVAGSGANATDAADFQNGVLPGGMVNFAAGEASQIVKVRVLRDAVAEADEHFLLRFQAPNGSELASAEGIVRNDDVMTSAFSLPSHDLMLIG
ncbi:Calx-beta domain-containing protein, partial [Roseomonas sp. F4]